MLTGEFIISDLTGTHRSLAFITFWLLFIFIWKFSILYITVSVGDFSKELKGNTSFHIHWNSLSWWFIFLLYDSEKQKIWVTVKSFLYEKNTWRNWLKLIICVVLRDLVPFLQSRKHEKHPWRRVTFSKVAGF